MAHDRLSGLCSPASVLGSVLCETELLLILFLEIEGRLPESSLIRTLFVRPPVFYFSSLYCIPSASEVNTIPSNSTQHIGPEP